MPRKPRKTGEFVHVIVRGVSRHFLFEDTSDRYYYLNLLKKYKDENDIVILAYCLMENHVHLLIRDPTMSISLFMKKMGVAYAFYFNTKYNRVGHLFQDRFLCEPIIGENTLMAVFRYILKNPQTAGIAPANRYKWNSYHEYGRENVLTDSTVLSELIGSKEDLDVFMQQSDDTDFLESERKKHDDNWALNLIRSTLSVKSGTELVKMNKDERNKAILLLRSKGVSVRQLERLTGISRGVIEYIEG